MISTLLALASALSFGGADFAGGLASRRASTGAVLLYSQLVGLLLALGLGPLVGSQGLAGSDLLFGALAGLAGAFGLFFLYRGLASGIVAIVSPSAAMLGTLIPLVFGLVAGERLAATDWGGIALALPAILLLSWEPSKDHGTRTQVRRSLVYGGLSGLGFGLFFILIARTGAGSGLWPLVAARGASIAALLSLALIRFTRLRPGFQLPRESWAPTATAGALDMAANVFFLLAARSGLLTISVVITSLYPAPTVVLAAFYFREGLRPFRILGLVLALASVALMSV